MGRSTKRAPPSETQFDYTLGDLYRETITVLWKGQRDEHESQYRWSYLVDLIGRDVPLAHIKRRHFQVAVDKLSSTKTNRGTFYKAGTINRFIAAGSKAFRWAVDEEILDAMPKLPWQEEEEGRISYIRENDVPRFITYIKTHQGPLIATACQILLVTGMRVGELMSLTRDQIEAENGSHYYIRLEAEDTKTKKCRSVPIPTPLALSLINLLEVGIPHYRMIYRACVNASRALGLPDKITPHVLRHSAATLMTKKGTPSLTVSKLLGHASLKTTKKYDHFIPATNPLASLVFEDEQHVPETTDDANNTTLCDSTRNLIDEQSITYEGNGGLVRIRTGVQGFAEASQEKRPPRKPLKTRGNSDS